MCHLLIYKEIAHTSIYVENEKNSQMLYISCDITYEMPSDSTMDSAL